MHPAEAETLPARILRERKPGSDPDWLRGHGVPEEDVAVLVMDPARMAECCPCPSPTGSWPTASGWRSRAGTCARSGLPGTPPVICACTTPPRRAAHRRPPAAPYQPEHQRARAHDPTRSPTIWPRWPGPGRSPPMRRCPRTSTGSAGSTSARPRSWPTTATGRGAHGRGRQAGPAHRLGHRYPADLVRGRAALHGCAPEALAETVRPPPVPPVSRRSARQQEDRWTRRGHAPDGRPAPAHEQHRAGRPG